MVELSPTAHRLQLTTGIVAAVLLLSVLAISPNLSRQQLTTLEQIQERGELRVITLNSATTYYQNAFGFSGFEYENSLSVGYGRKAIKQDNMELDLEIGPGARFYKPDEAESEDEALLVLAAKYWWAITDNSKFLQDFNFDIGEQYTDSKSVTGIRANINKTLALKFTYTIRHKSEVPDPATTEKTDTEAAMTLVYTF